MRIALICPTWTDDLGMYAALARRRNSQPPLGILYLATIAEKRGHTVRAIDADVEDFTVESLAREIISERYDLVGLTATSPIYHKAVHLASDLKKMNFTAPIVIGGEHINIFKEEAFLDCFDYAFYGESDFTFGQFLDILSTGGNDFSDMRGFIHRVDGKTVVSDPAQRIEDLDQLPFPAMQLLRRDRYIMTFAKWKARPYLPLMATRGCPFKCAFCSEPLTNPYVRFRSPGNIVDELEKLKTELGNNHFFFLDSNLTLKRQQIEGVCNEILKRNLKITFEGWTRANLVDRELLHLLRTAGLIRMSYGIESGDPEVLRIIRKEVKHEDMRNAFRMTVQEGIEPACSVMLGLPGDTKASVTRTINFVRSIPEILYSNFSIANPYPGTQMYEWAKEGRHGVRLLISDHSQYRRYDFSPIAVNDLNQEDLVRLQKIGLLKMHLKPRRMWAAMKMAGLGTLIPVFLRFVATWLRPSAH
jgi:anaerobic magnesium-protoporphyrin IX monomethyl ester cyclase